MPDSIDVKMVGMVSEIKKQPIIGRQLFDMTTSGMYDNPLMIFREYVQNSVARRYLADIHNCK